MARVGLQRQRKKVVVVVVTLCLLINMSVLCSFKCGHIPQFHNCQSSCHTKLNLLMSYRSIYAHILKVHLTFLSRDYSNISSQKSKT